MFANCSGIVKWFIMVYMITSLLAFLFCGGVIVGILYLVDEYDMRQAEKRLPNRRKR